MIGDIPNGKMMMLLIKKSGTYLLEALCPGTYDGSNRALASFLVGSQIDQFQCIQVVRLLLM